MADTDSHQRAVSRRTALLGAMIFAGSLLIGVGAIRSYEGLSMSGQPCALGITAFLNGASVQGFTLAADRTITSLPFGIEGGTPSQGFQSARSLAYINDVALESPYRQQEDAVASSLGYTVGRWPLVPLTGQVVRDNAGVLELTQTNWAFSDAAAAASFFSLLERNAGGVVGVPVQWFDVRLGDGAFGYTSSEGPNDGLHERVVVVTVRLGSALIQLNARGGSSVAAATGRELGTRAASVLKSVCLAVAHPEASR